MKIIMQQQQLLLLAVEAWPIQARTMEPIHNKCFWFNFQTSLPLVLVTGGCDGGGKRAAGKILERCIVLRHDH